MEIDFIDKTQLLNCMQTNNIKGIGQLKRFKYQTVNELGGIAIKINDNLGKVFAQKLYGCNRGKVYEKELIDGKYFKLDNKKYFIENFYQFKNKS